MDSDTGLEHQQLLVKTRPAGRPDEKYILYILQKRWSLTPVQSLVPVANLKKPKRWVDILNYTKRKQDAITHTAPWPGLLNRSTVEERK
jgi:hypothetical protein